MNLTHGLIDIGFILLGVLATYVIFRRTSRAVIIYRIPPFLTCAVFLLYCGLISLPSAFTPLFTMVFGQALSRSPRQLGPCLLRRHVSGVPVRPVRVVLPVMLLVFAVGGCRAPHRACQIVC